LTGVEMDHHRVVDSFERNADEETRNTAIRYRLDARGRRAHGRRMRRGREQHGELGRRPGSIDGCLGSSL
jgi:hypothetical protein